MRDKFLQKNMPHNSTSLTSKVVIKPWGKEYLCNQNKIVAIWVLHINYLQKTSMHCHPRKDTGLVVLDGTAELSFLNNKITLKPLNKIHIFRRRFHSTKALSKKGCCLLEIENPNNKKNLLRISDSYGREKLGYEGSSHMIPKSKKTLTLSLKIKTCIAENHYR